MDSSFSSGFFAENTDSNETFGRYFHGRSPGISEIMPNRGTPPELMYRTGQTDPTNVSKSTSLDRQQSKSTTSSTSQCLSTGNKWPADENTYLIGDVKNWAKYRPVDRSINFTELIEENTIYDQNRTLRPHLFRPSVNTSKSTYFSFDGPSTSRLSDCSATNSTNFKSFAMNIYVDGESTKVMTSKPVSNGNSRKVTARAALGDISGKVQITQNRCPSNLLELSSQKWLDPVREVYEKKNRQQRERSNIIVPATTQATPSLNASLKVSKIPVSTHRQKSPVPNRLQQPIANEPNNDLTHMIENFPLKANKAEVIWECTTLGKSVTKTFSIKNSGDMMLRLKIDVIGADFNVNVKTLDLQSNEESDIDVTFCPSVIGKALGKVIITPITTSRYWSADTERRLYLCAYGGASGFLLQGIEHIPVNSLLLKDEEYDVFRTKITFKGTFCIANRGSVNSTIILFTKPKKDGNRMTINNTQITITPQKLVIHPNESSNITIACQLGCQELESFRHGSSELVTIASVMYTFGSEPDCQRILNILAHTDDSSLRETFTFLMDAFPVTNIEQFNDFRDRDDHVKDLFGAFTVGEIDLNINRAKVDETLDAFLTCMENEA